MTMKIEQMYHVVLSRSLSLSELMEKNEVESLEANLPCGFGASATSQVPHTQNISRPSTVFWSSTYVHLVIDRPPKNYEKSLLPRKPLGGKSRINDKIV